MCMCVCNKMEKKGDEVEMVGKGKGRGQRTLFCKLFKLVVLLERT